MKKTGLLLLLCMTAAAVAQQADPKPAQYKSELVGVCTRSTGKLTEVGTVPSGVD